MPKLTEDSPEVVLAAAFNDESTGALLRRFKGDDYAFKLWHRAVEAARKLAAEGRLGPGPGVEAFRARVLEYLERAAEEGETKALRYQDNGYGYRAYAFRVAHQKIRDMDAGEQPETWEPTMSLRWIEVNCAQSTREPAETRWLLQQLWRSSDGREEWRDVEVQK